MKTIKILALLIISSLALTSCDSDDDGPNLVAVESEQVSNLFAPTTGGGQGQPDEGPFVKFDFATGTTTTSETEWDIAFRSTAIIVNGGTSQGTSGEPDRNQDAAVYIVEDTFANVTEVESSLFEQDSQAGYAITRAPGQGWYNYEPFPVNLITPISGRVLVFRTRDGKFAKVSIKSYYEDAPSNNELDANIHNPRYYTFDYVYQPNEGVTTF